MLIDTPLGLDIETPLSVLTSNDQSDFNCSCRSWPVPPGTVTNW